MRLSTLTYRTSQGEPMIRNLADTIYAVWLIVGTILVAVGWTMALLWGM